MRKLPTSLLALLLLLPGLPAGAQNNFDLGDLDPGQVLLNLSAAEQIEVEQDTLSATLQYSTQGRDKNALQDEVNRAMAGALALLEEDAGDVEFSTGQYQVYTFQPGRPNRGDIEDPLWRAEQSLRLTGRDSGELLELAGQLQEAGLHITSLRYSLSPEKYREVADSLLEAVLARLRGRAEEAASALGKGSAELIELSINDNMPLGYYPDVMMARASAADAEAMTPPSASPGLTQVTVNVSARALLSP